MNLKKILKPSWLKIFLTIIITITIAILAYASKNLILTTPNLIENMPVLDGLQFYKLNPILWLPAPLITSNHNYIFVSPTESNKIFYITLPYWIIVSYLFASFSLSKVKK